MRCLDANGLYRAMERSVERERAPRASEDATSPQRGATVEAEIGSSFVLAKPELNFLTSRPVNARWAAANTLHFFAATEEAGALRQYNRHAERFLTGDRWVGAYGAIAVPQLARCVELLRASTSSRRAVVSMGELGHQDINQPACWSFLHLLAQGGALSMFVYQRSLNLPGVFPYDCVVLTNVLHFCSKMLDLPMGRLHWTIGSLHAPEGWAPVAPTSQLASSLLLPFKLLAMPSACYDALERPSEYPEVKELLL